MGESTAIENCFDHNNLDIPGLWSLLKPECTYCNLVEMDLDNRICSDCNFGFNSKYNNERTRVCCTKHFRKYGLKKNLYQHVGKHQLYFFLYHPELNFKFPQFPDTDMFGRPQKDTWKWHIHHIKKYYIDTKKDLLLCLITEHKFFEKYKMLSLDEMNKPIFLKENKIISWRWNY